MSVQALTDLAERLEDEGVGTVGTDIFVGRMPDQPDSCVALTSYIGDPPRFLGNDNLPADERLSIQVIARAGRDASSTAASLIDSVYDALPFRHETLTSGRRYDWCAPNHTPAQLDRDENDRPRFVLNVSVKRARTDV